MTRFKPNTQYIYENVDGIIYAREFSTTDRFEIGRIGTRLEKDKIELDLWKEILAAAETNLMLQQELERVKIIYLLSKSESFISHHPV